MSNFKVGDWVIWDRGKTFEVHQIVEGCLVKNHSALDNGINVHNEDLAMWKPKPGEWLWINTRKDSLPFIACLLTQLPMDGSLVFTDYTILTNGRRQDVLIHPDELISLEPFLGELPSFCKGDTRCGLKKKY